MILEDIKLEKAKAIDVLEGHDPSLPRREIWLSAPTVSLEIYQFESKGKQGCGSQVNSPAAANLLKTKVRVSCMVSST
jgi:hypothetical protein